MREPHAVRFGRRLKEARLSAKLTQGQLAIKLGVSNKMISHYEQGESELPLHMMPRLIQVIGRDFGYFFPDLTHVAGANYDEEWLSYLGRRVESMPAGVVRETYKNTLRDFADTQANALRTVHEELVR